MSADWYKFKTLVTVVDLEGCIEDLEEKFSHYEDFEIQYFNLDGSDIWNIAIHLPGVDVLIRHIIASEVILCLKH